MTVTNPAPNDRTPHSAAIPQMFTTRELSQLIGVPVATLNNWRSLGQGPRSFRLGRSVRYCADDVLAWIAHQQHVDTHYLDSTA